MSKHSLPAGCTLTPLRPIEDSRGILTEVYRENWQNVETSKVQWNLVRSKAGVLRGQHVHGNRTDYLIVVEGEMWLGLYDMRRQEPSFGESSLVRMRAEDNLAVFIPTGVAHGFYFLKPSLTLYGLSSYWSLDDEMGCHPLDPALGIEWPGAVSGLSDRDRAAGTLAEMQLEYDKFINHD